MKVLLIWLGKMWQFHLQNLLNIEKVSKIYAFDIMVENFKIQNEKIIYINNLDDLEYLWNKITISDIDFVDIVAPTKFHKSYLEIFIKNNKNIFVEKPMVSTFEELDHIDKLIKKSNYSWKIWVWFIERFNCVSKFFKDKIKEKWEPKQIEIFRYNPWSDRIWDVDVTTDLMIHDLDLVNYFFDWKNIELKWKNIHNDSSTVLLKANKTNITLSANRITQQKIREIKFYYDDITITWDLMLAKINLYHKPSEYLSTKGQDLSITYMLEEKILLKTNQLKEELEEFIDIINWWKYKNLSNYSAWKNSINILNKLTK